MTHLKTPPRPDTASAPAPVRVTLKTLADHLDLSTATISIVLNRKPEAKAIPPETQHRVFTAARDFGYRPNQLARSLRRQKSTCVGVLVPEIGESYVSEVIAGIEMRLLRAGYHCLLGSHHSGAEPLERPLERLRDQRIGGLITVATTLAMPVDLPTVAIADHRPLPGMAKVVLDHDAAATLGLGHLRELGHERIAVIKGQPSSIDTEERWRAIREQATLLGLSFPPEMIHELQGKPGVELFSPGTDYEGGRVCGREILERGARPTAVFAFNDASALGLIQTLQAAGWHVPRDISVLGFDDIWNAAANNPGLTTIRQPLRLMGEHAARILLEHLEENTPTLHGGLAVPPELIVRGSTGPAEPV